MKNTEFELDIVRSHADVLHSRKKAGTLKTFYQALRRLLYALGGKATDADNTDVTLIERMAEVAEGGGISPSASGLPNHDKLVVIPGTNIGSVSGETLLAKVQRAVSQEVIPIGKPFTGFFTSAARYYCDGFLYYSENKLYGYVNVSSYSRPYFFTVSADVWTVRNAVASPLPVSEGGTGAATALAAKTNLGLGELMCQTVAFANHTSTGITIKNNTAGAIITSGASGDVRDLIWFVCVSDGSTSFTRLRNAEGLTVTAGTNKITIANASGVYCYAITLFY